MQSRSRRRRTQDFLPPAFAGAERPRPPRAEVKARETLLRRSRLGRDIAIIVAVKLMALIAIKLIWFSDPPPVSDIDRVLLGSSVEQQSVRGRY